MSKKKVSALFISGILFLTGCSSEAYPKADYEEKLSTSINYIIAGRVTGVNSDISSKLSGKVSQIMVSEGSKVKAGEVLLKIEAKELEAQLAQANAGVAVAQSNYEKVKVGARDQQKIQAKAVLDSAKKSEEAANNNYERNKLLYESGGVSKQQLESFETQLQLAVSQRISAQAQFDLLNQGESKETLKVLEAQVNQAKAAENSVKIQLDNQLVTAPYDGIISKKYIEVGEMASSGSKLFTLQGNQSLKVEGNLPESLIGKLAENDEVLVRFPDLPELEALDGLITMINPTLDGSGKGASVEVSISKGNELIKTGMFAEVGLKK